MHKQTDLFFSTRHESVAMPLQKQTPYGEWGVGKEERLHPGNSHWSGWLAWWELIRILSLSECTLPGLWQMLSSDTGGQETIHIKLLQNDPFNTKSKLTAQQVEAH